MRIAVFYQLPFGGAKRVVQEHVKGLKGLGHHVDVYTLDREKDAFTPGIYSDNEYRYEYNPFKLKFPVLSRLVADLQIFYTLKNLHKVIAQDIDSKDYDVVLVHTDTYTQSPFILQFLKTKNVYFCLEPLRMVYEYSLRISEGLGIFNRIYEQINRYIRKKVDRHNARAAMHTIALSYFGREYMIHAYDLYPQVVYLGVDEKLFRPTNIQKKKQVLFVAEKEYIYGYDLVEKAMKLIPATKRPELVFVFGTKKSQRITDEELVRMYNESVVTLSLSRYDTFGLVPLESMACGTPVIALKVAGYRETMRDTQTGYLVEFDPQEIAEKIMYFMDNPTKAKEMGNNGRRHVEAKWTWELQIKQLEKVLKKIVTD